MSIETLLLLSAGFFIIALLYSSVGFGGGSSYLALLALVLPGAMGLIKTTGLLCNLVVVSSGTYLFIRQGLFDARRFIPLVVCSVPLAFWGATIHLSEKAFFISLGAALMLSGILLIVQQFMKRNEVTGPSGKPQAPVLALGGGVGFLSGLVGIGGGILLSPILNLIRWDSAKRIAALASFFILVNSVAGLAGQAYEGKLELKAMPLLPLLLAVFIGGQLGTRLSLKRIKPSWIKGITGVLVCYIGIKLILNIPAE